MVKKLFAVLGDPIGHSMSPMMHNDLFSFYNIDGTYLPFQVKTEDLKEAVKGLKALGAAGFNVTVPHKKAIIPYLDEVEELALSIGAVNTVVNENGRLIGFNTDGPGFMQGLKNLLPAVNHKKILIIGSGGAARAIYFTLAKNTPGRVDIANRTLSKAQELAAECPFGIESKAMSLWEAEESLSAYDLIVQTTTIGMVPNVEGQPISLMNLAPQAAVSDIIYNPFETQILRDAKERGAMVQNGLDMFVYQGALAFEKWTGIFPDAERMRKNVFKQLGGKTC